MFGVYVGVAEGSGLLGNLSVQLPWCSLFASLGQMLRFAAGQTCTQKQELCPTDWDGEFLCAHSWAAPVSPERSLGLGVHRFQQPTFTSLTCIIQIHFLVIAAVRMRSECVSLHLKLRAKIQTMVGRVAVVGQWSHLQSALGETMLHVIRKLLQWTIIENKWDMNRNTGRLSRFIFVGIKYHIWSKKEKQGKSTEQFPSIMKWLKQRLNWSYTFEGAWTDSVIKSEEKLIPCCYRQPMYIFCILGTEYLCMR